MKKVGDRAQRIIRISKLLRMLCGGCEEIFSSTKDPPREPHIFRSRPWKVLKDASDFSNSADTGPQERCQFCTFLVYSIYPKSERANLLAVGERLDAHQHRVRPKSTGCRYYVTRDDEFGEQSRPKDH